MPGGELYLLLSLLLIDLCITDELHVAISSIMVVHLCQSGSIYFLCLYVTQINTSCLAKK